MNHPGDPKHHPIPMPMNRGLQLIESLVEGLIAENDCFDFTCFRQHNESIPASGKF